MVDRERVNAALLEVHQTGETDVVSALDLIAHAVSGAFVDCRWASVTVIDEGTPLTVSYRGGPALAADEAQYNGNGGPCTEAARTLRAVAVEDVAADSRWPRFSEAAAAAGVATALAVPFIADGSPVGAVNLYSDRAHAFGPEARAAAEEVASHAGVAIGNVLRRADREVDLANLRTALTTRDVIGQAKGILMHARRVTDDEAFDLLRRASQDRNVKLREVAAEVARTGTLDAVS